MTIYDTEHIISDVSIDVDLSRIEPKHKYWNRVQKKHYSVE